MTGNMTVSSSAVLEAPIRHLQQAVDDGKHNVVASIEKEGANVSKASMINSRKSSLEENKGVVAENFQDPRDISNIKPNNPASSPVCRNCNTSTTPLWRRDEHGSVLCNACGLFLKLHGRPRPISLKTDVIKSRNRKSNHHESPSEKKRKDVPDVSFGHSGKKKKSEHSQQNSQNSTTQNTQTVSITNRVDEPDSRFAKIMPKNDVSKADSLPHLSSLLADRAPVQKSSEYPVSASHPALTVGISSPQITSLQRPPPHLASINEILNTNPPQNPHPKSLTNFQTNGITSPTENGITSPVMGPLVGIGGPLAQVMLNHTQSVVSSPRQQQISVNSEGKHSHFSTSPPPMELHANSHSHSSTSSNKTFSRNQETECIPESEQRNINADTQHTKNILGLDRHNTLQRLHQERAPSLAMTLQSQEEEIKLHTKISELELVTDLYKRHIFELDAKCSFLEKELAALKTSRQEQR